MKFIFRAAITLALLGAGQAFVTAARAQAPTQAQAESLPCSLDRSTHDFGTLARGETRQTTFTLTNTGTEPLILLDARVGCRCTRVEWPRRPIAPGARATLTVSYKNRQPGTFYQVIELVTAAPSPIRLTIRGEVAGR